MPQKRTQISVEEVAHLADLARIDLTVEERERLAPQLAVVVEYADSLEGVAADDVPATSHPLPLRNVLRDDVPRPSLSAQQALSGAPAVEQQRFEVPRILGDEQ